MILFLLLTGVLSPALSVQAGEEGPSEEFTEEPAEEYSSVDEEETLPVKDPVETSGTVEDADEFVITQNRPEYAILIDADTRYTDYFPEPVEIASYGDSDIPYDANGKQIMWRWCFEPGNPNAYMRYDDDGSLIATSTQNPVSIGKEAGMGRIYIYLSYPGAGNYDNYYIDTYFWLTMTNSLTGYTYTAVLDYGLNTAELWLPAGLYTEVELTSSSNLTLPPDMYCPNTFYVQAGKFSHMDIVAPPGKSVAMDERTIVLNLKKYSEEMRPTVIYEAKASLSGVEMPEGTAETAPVSETAPAGVTPETRDAVKPSEMATGGGVLSGLDDSPTTATAAAERDVEGLIRQIMICGAILAVIVLSVAVILYRHGGAKKDKDEKQTENTDSRKSK